MQDREDLARQAEKLERDAAEQGDAFWGQDSASQKDKLEYPEVEAELSAQAVDHGTLSHLPSNAGLDSLRY